MTKKKLITTSCSILAFAALAAGAYFITKSLDDTKSVSTTEYLVSVHEWQKVGEESVVWTFEGDGTCKITTNSVETFDCQWQLNGETITIKTKWLRELEDEFTISVNQPENTFTIISEEDGKISTFIPKKSA